MGKKVLLIYFEILALCLILTVSISVWNWFEVKRSQYLSGDYIVYTDSDTKVLGITDQTSSVTVDFSQSPVTGSPAVFGGTQSPTGADQANAWSQLAQTGVTSVRKDFFLEYSLPGNTNIADYKSNKNGIANIQNWRTSNINTTGEIYNNAKKNGMNTIGIVSYAPPWLTYSGNQHGVPRDWAAYEDMVSKLYRTYRNNLDSVEIWNEPTYKYFLDLKNSGMTREEAYLQIFLHASHAIKTVDEQINDGKYVKIGGQASHKIDDLSIAEKLLQDPQANNEMDFISFHFYGTSPPDLTAWKNLLHKYNKDTLPIYISEWNYSSDVKTDQPQLTGPAAIPYTGSMLMSFLSDGISGANYYSLFPIDRQKLNYGTGYLAFYQLINGKAVLLPQAKTWQLLSKTLGLGAGTSQIFQSNTTNNVTAIGFKNSSGIYGITLDNTSTTSKEITINIRNLPYNNYINLLSYKADTNFDATQQVSQTVASNQDSTISSVVNAPPNSVVGILLTPSGPVQYKADTVLHQLFTR